MVIFHAKGYSTISSGHRINVNASGSCIDGGVCAGSSQDSFFLSTGNGTNIATSTTSSLSTIYIISSLGYIGFNGGTFVARPSRPALCGLDIITKVMVQDKVRGNK